MRLAVITQLFQSLGRAGALLGMRLLQGLGQLCAGAAEAEDAGNAAAPIAGPARVALGTAVRNLGPEAVLDALPLQLQEVRSALTVNASDAVLYRPSTPCCSSITAGCLSVESPWLGGTNPLHWSTVCAPWL